MNSAPGFFLATDVMKLKTLNSQIFLAGFPIATLCAAVFLCRGVLFAQPPPRKFQLPPEPAALKSGPNADLVSANCRLCHSVDYITTQPAMDRAAWLATITKMREKFGAPLATDTLPAIAEYLAKNYGKEKPAPLSH